MGGMPVTLELHYILIQGDLAGFSPSKRIKMESIEKCSPSRPLFTSTPLEIDHAYDSLKFCIICEVFCMVPQVLLRGSAYFKLYLRN
jgi:hypothetical protein